MSSFFGSSPKDRVVSLWKCAIAYQSANYLFVIALFELTYIGLKVNPPTAPISPICRTPLFPHPTFYSCFSSILFFAHRTHFSHMSHPTFPISHILFLFLLKMFAIPLGFTLGVLGGAIFPLPLSQVINTHTPTLPIYPSIIPRALPRAPPRAPPEHPPSTPQAPSKHPPITSQ